MDQFFGISWKRSGRAHHGRDGEGSVEGSKAPMFPLWGISTIWTSYVVTAPPRVDCPLRSISVTPEAGRPHQVSPPLRRTRCVAGSCIVVSRFLISSPGHLAQAAQAVRQPAAQPSRSGA